MKDCGCIQINKEKSGYENIKKLAEIYSKHENVEVYLYKIGENFAFKEVDCKEANLSEAIEFIHPLL